MVASTSVSVKACQCLGLTLRRSSNAAAIPQVVIGTVHGLVAYRRLATRAPDAPIRVPLSCALSLAVVRGQPVRLQASMHGSKCLAVIE